MLLSLALAVLASLFMGGAAVAQAHAARRVATAGVLLHPWYLAGLTMDFVGWLASLVAMRHLPLLVVQTILAGSLAVTVVVARAVLRVPLTRRAAWTVVVLTVAVVVVSCAGEAGRPGEPPGWFRPVMVAVVAVLVVASVLARNRGVSLLAGLAGLGYSCTAVAARAAHAGSWQELATDPLTWCAAVSGIVGTVMFARALQADENAVAPATAWLWVVEVIVPAAVGVAVLGDRVRPGWQAATVVGVVVALVAAVVLSRAAAAVDGPAHASEPAA